MLITGGDATASGTALLIAVAPVGKGRLIDASSVLPALAAVPPSALTGTASATVIELADPLDPQTVLTRVRAAAAADGPLFLYLAGQVQLDRKQRLPHLALARSTPSSLRYTGLPWHWLASELTFRRPGTTTVVVDLVADQDAWVHATNEGLGLGSSIRLYGRIAARQGRRDAASPDYLKAYAAIWRSGSRPDPATLHEQAAEQAGTEGALLLAGADWAGAFEAYGESGEYPGGSAAAPPPAALPGPPATHRAGTVLPPPHLAPWPPAGEPPAAAPQPPGVPRPAHPAAPDGAGTPPLRTEVGPPAAWPAADIAPPPPAAGYTPAPNRGLWAAHAERSVPRPTGEGEPAPEAHAFTAAPTESPAESARPATAPHPHDPHPALLAAARAGRHDEAAAAAVAWELQESRTHGPGSVQAIHWLEVRADLARIAGEPGLSSELWMTVAEARLAREQSTDDPDVEGAVDRAHHQWEQIKEPEAARALAPRLVSLRRRVPGRQRGALRVLQRRLESLHAGRPA
ncbi:hypothetical protein [Streptomyces sp. NPDC020965]|uniref:hypothetical protein n=1 Tax=Streptomyces sp. NPDC020965 TaxID=3365105 RepID=UPI0037A6DAD5